VYLPLYIAAVPSFFPTLPLHPPVGILSPLFSELVITFYGESSPPAPLRFFSLGY